MKRNIIILTEQWVCFKALPQQFNNELGKSNRHTPTQNTIHDFIPTAWSQFPIGGNIPESNFYIKPETKAFRFPVFVFRIPADFSSLAIADVSISSEYTTPMCMLIFLYIPHTYSTRSTQSTNILYANCNLSPILSTCCVYHIPSNNLENHSKIYFSLRSNIYNRNNFLFFSSNRSFNIQSPFFHPISKIVLRLQQVSPSQDRFSVYRLSTYRVI